MKASEYDKLKAMTKRKFSKLKIELDEQQIKLDELDELVEHKTRAVIKRKLIKQVINAIQTDLEALEGRMLNKVAEGYYEYVRAQTNSLVKTEISKGVLFKHMVIHDDVLHTYSPVEMLSNNWRIVYQGPLKFDDAGRKNPVTIFEKAVLNKAHAKATIHDKPNKIKKKKKVKRKPM